MAIPRVPLVRKTAGLPEMILPVIWFEDGVTELPEDLQDLLRMAENVPQVRSGNGRCGLILRVKFYLVYSNTKNEKCQIVWKIGWIYFLTTTPFLKNNQ